MFYTLYPLITIGLSIAFCAIGLNRIGDGRLDRYRKQRLCGCMVMFIIFLSNTITVVLNFGKTNLLTGTIWIFSVIVSLTSFLLTFIPMARFFSETHRKGMLICQVLAYYAVQGMSLAGSIAFVIKAVNDSSWLSDTRNFSWLFLCAFDFFAIMLPYPGKSKRKYKKRS